MVGKGTESLNGATSLSYICVNLVSLFLPRKLYKGLPALLLLLHVCLLIIAHVIGPENDDKNLKTAKIVMLTKISRLDAHFVKDVIRNDWRSIGLLNKLLLGM
jgi:hypothetical protein